MEDRIFAVTGQQSGKAMKKIMEAIEKTKVCSLGFGEEIIKYSKLVEESKTYNEEIEKSLNYFERISFKDSFKYMAEISKLATKRNSIHKMNRKESREMSRRLNKR